MTGPVLDTSVLVDIFVKQRPRHEVAATLAKRLRQDGVTVQLPMHALFELAAAMRAEKAGGHRPFSTVFTESAPMRVVLVPIDEAFFTRYFDVTLPRLRSGDLIFLALAKGAGAPLISEDRELLEAARTAGVSAYTTAEYLGADAR